jgi:hypothetical protein
MWTPRAAELGFALRRTTNTLLEQSALVRRGVLAAANAQLAWRFD